MNSTWPNHIGKSYPGAGGYKVEEEIIEQQDVRKLVFLQKIRFKKDNRIE
jgi:hypothetical protein